MRRRGFTLVEVLIVVIVLGILAAIVVPQFADAGDRAKLSARAATQRQVEQMIAIRRLRGEPFPADPGELFPDGRLPANPFANAPQDRQHIDVPHYAWPSFRYSLDPRDTMGPNQYGWLYSPAAGELFMRLPPGHAPADGAATGGTSHDPGEPQVLPPVPPN